MSNAAALKKKAAEFESKKQFDKALALYKQVLDDDEGEEDVALYNRVGELYLRQGQVAEAMQLFERAVDRYDDQGLYNNAIALCNKILRQSPGRTSVYYKLGKVSAKKGFKNDAKANFLEYAERKRKDGDANEAFRALKEFAALCPDQDDIRLMLADQLAKAGRNQEALEQLHALHARQVAEGETAQASATAERMRAIDPSVVPIEGGAKADAARKTGELVFLDVEGLSPPRKGTPLASPAVLPPTAAPPKAPPPAAPATPPAPAAPLPFNPLPEDPIGGTFTVDLGLPLLPLDDGAPTPPPAPPAPPVPRSPAPAPSRAATPPAAPPPKEAPTLDIGDVVDPLVAEYGESLGLDTDALRRASLSRPAVPEPPPGDPSGLDLIDPTIADTGGSALDDLLPLLDDVIAPPPPAPGLETFPELPSSAVGIGRTVLSLRARLDRDPENWDLMRTYAEALLEDGEREAGIAALEEAMAGYEAADDLVSARAVCDDLVRLEPEVLSHHQKRVEYCHATNDRGGLIDAFVDLAHALLTDGHPDKAQALYERVLQLAPGEARAVAALQSLGIAPPTPAPPAPAPLPPAAAPKPAAPEPPAPPAEPPPPPRRSSGVVAVGSDGFVDLGDFLLDDEPERSTRMKAEAQEPTGDEDADFQDMLRKFKQGVAENVDEEDYDSHYDLGVAFKEMGLVDEAIAQFQKALRGTQHRVRAHEALGQCFVDKGLWSVALTILERAVAEGRADDAQLVGVLYLLGVAYEELGRAGEALAAYQRVYAVDIGFRDVGPRLEALARGGR